jgi:hypothetical protein
MSDDLDDPKVCDGLNSKVRVEWQGLGVMAMPGPNGPVALYIEGATEVLIVENIDYFRRLIDKTLAEFALREKAGLPRRDR